MIFTNVVFVLPAFAWWYLYIQHVVRTHIRPGRVVAAPRRAMEAVEVQIRRVDLRIRGRCIRIGAKAIDDEDAQNVSAAHAQRGCRHRIIERSRPHREARPLKVVRSQLQCHIEHAMVVGGAAMRVAIVLRRTQLERLLELACGWSGRRAACIQGKAHSNAPRNKQQHDRRCNEGARTDTFAPTLKTVIPLPQIWRVNVRDLRRGLWCRGMRQRLLHPFACSDERALS